jgi:ribosomal protein S12 methylthiotransferase accessory factor
MQAERLLSVPGDFRPPVTASTSDTGDLIARNRQWLAALGPRGNGIIVNHTFYRPHHDEPDLHHFHVRYRDCSQPHGVFSAGGTSSDPHVAVVKGIAEAVERHCASTYDAAGFVTASAREIGAEAVDPHRFVLFRDDQYRNPGFLLRPLRSRARLRWQEARALHDRRQVFVPAVCVHVPCRPESADECFELAPVSGYACGTSLEQAVLHGLCEVIERDAFMVAWYTGRRPVAIDLRTTPPSIQARLARFGRVGARLYCVDVTSDLGVPAFITLMKSTSLAHPAIAVAAAADLSPERAIGRALDELASNHLLVRGLWRPGSPPPLSIETPEDHGLLYADPAATPRLDRLLRPSGLVDFATLPAAAEVADPETALSVCRAALERCGLEAFYVDLTVPQVAALGFRVVKVLVPGLHPIDFGLSHRHFGGARLAEVPRRLGYDPSPLNLDPHPFP